MTENTRPSTGDPVVDGTLAEFDERADGPLPERVAAATEAHRRLQQRLADPAAPDRGEEGQGGCAEDAGQGNGA